MTLAIDTLPNGLRVVTERMPGVASAAVGVWIEAGTRHETAAENGIAHFLEHMAFKGTARRTARQIAEEIEDVGGYLNAYTARERTAYYARVMAEDVPLALDLLADILLEPQFAESEIEVERGVILQEIGQARDTPDDIIWDWLQETAYPDQPMGRAILGPPERVEAFEKRDLRRFVEGHYRPERIVIAAAGAVEHDAVLRLSERLFGGLARRPAPAVEPARYAGGEMRVEKPLEQAHLALALPAPAYMEEDYYAAQVFATALGGGMSSRLFQELREERGLCYTIFAQGSAWADSGLMAIYAGTGAGEIGGLTELTIDETRRAAEGLTEPELARARAQFRAGLAMGLESPFARAERLANLLAIWGRVRPVEETLAEIDAVDAVAARKVAERMLAAAPTLALYGPVSGAPALGDLARRLAA